jgi:hypothetical protein
MSGSDGGSNGPVIVNGGADVYDRTIGFDAPVAFDTGLVVQQPVTLAQLRADLMVLLGFATMAGTPPPGMTTTLNLYLRLAQAQLYWRYRQLRTERWWPWQLVAGQRFYDLPVDGVDVLEARRITAAFLADNGGQAASVFAPSTALALNALTLPSTKTGLVYRTTTAGTTGTTEPTWPTAEGQTVVSGTVTFTAIAPPAAVWSPLVAGIPAGDFTLATNGIPTHYEVREYIEVYPAPDKPYLLYLKGHLGLRRFDEDTDYATIDPDPLLLYAAAMAKAHYRQPDANNYATMAQGLIRDLTAGAHTTKRYLPGDDTSGLKVPLGFDGAGSLPLPRATWRS